MAAKILAHPNKSHPAHGHGADGHRSPEYQTWIAMRQRCNDPKHVNFKRYGAMGISVCARWDSFEAFLADMGPRPEGMTLDRRDYTGNYDPGNCRWATDNQQAGNRSSNRFVLLAGEKLTVIDAARKCGVPMRTVYHWHKRVGEMGSIDPLLAKRFAT